jgi:hypothetical protein
MAPNRTLDSTPNPTPSSARNPARISTRPTMLNSSRKFTGLLACLTLAAGIAGCRVQVDKGANGEQKKVQVDTPFGGIHVNTDQTSAADLGLPTYPGANIVNDKDNEKSADIHMGFGEWELRVKVVNFSTPDSQDKVLAFYKNALARYGDVITCKGTTPVGTPTQTSEGLTCEDDKNNTSTVQIDRGDYGGGENSLELKAGSKRHQHIVGFNTSESGQTRFALVALDLPAGATGGSGKSD